jgi:hypothetical protein
MLTPVVRRGLVVLAAIAALLLLGLLLAPSVPRPIAERVLAGQVQGGKAQVDQAQLAWFGGEGAVGVRLDGVSLDDGKGRPVLRASHVEAGLGLDSLLLFAPAPSRLVVKDFFAAASVSPQGRYMLGYDAVGPPVPLDIPLIFKSLTGKARRDRPLSYVRHVDLQNGVLQFRQVAGPVAWKAQIQKVAFDKKRGQIASNTRLVVDGATINSRVRGAVGLKALAASGSIAGLNPARIFPAVGVTEPLSILNAPLQGRARIDYAADRGITAADVTGGAGAGTLRLGPVVQQLSGAQLVTRYDAATKQVVLQTLRLEAERTRLDMTGRLWLVAEKARQPARLEYRLASAESYFSLNPTSPSQTLQNLAIAGSVTPKTGRLEVADLRVLLQGAPVRLNALLYSGKDRASPGVKANIAVTGPMSIQTLYAFWPDKLAAPVRTFVTPRLHTATVLGSTVRADIPPGQLDKRQLTNEMLRVAFTYANGGVKVAPTLPGIEQAVGQGVVQGNRFDLTMATGRIGKLAISDAVVSVPRFRPGGAVASVRSRAQGDLGDMLRLIDSPPLNMMGATNMSPERFSGPADLIIDMKLPLKKGVTRADAKVSYAGTIHQLRIKDVTLGEDLTGGELVTHGTLDRVDANGTGKVGPYRGKLDFWMPLKGADAGRKHIVLDGQAGLLPGKGAPIRIDINTRNGIGGADVHSQMFEGRADWRKGERMLAQGVGHPAAWRQAGIPAGKGMPESVPVRLAMTADGGQWTGALDADAYSGALAYTRGNPRVIRYNAEITPAEAQRMGIGKLPMFKRTQAVALIASVGDGAGSADYKIGGLAGALEWSPGGPGAVAYAWKTTLDGDDLTGLGLPLKLAQPLPVSAKGMARGGGLSGSASLTGAVLRYDIGPEREGRRQIGFSGTASDRTLAAVGLDVTRIMDGPLDFSGRLTRAGGALSGRLVGDFDRTALRLSNSGWSKPAGQKAQGALDLVLNADGLTLKRITADGEGITVRGSGALTRAGDLSLSLPTARLNGFFDGSVTASRNDAGAHAKVAARYLDFRPILKEAQRLAGGNAARGIAKERFALDANIDRVRVTDSGYVNGVNVSGNWGEVAQRKVTLTATSDGGGAIDIRAYPEAGTTALSLSVADLGDIAKTLAGYDNLRGGATKGSGRIVPGGYDFDFEIRDMTMLRVPGAAQLLARDGAIQFDRMVAPMRIRGGKVTLGDVVATGPSVGLTAKGIMDTKTRTMDVVGVVTPAYGVNGMLGRMTGAPEGEGLFGITYRAWGPFTAPKIDINPLSLALPGFFRRLFEPDTPEHQP